MREGRRISVYGAVQGVGFRPFVYRLANEIGLGGNILNSSSGVVIEIEGESRRVEEFLTRLPEEKPPSSVIVAMEDCRLDPLGSDTFEILPSDPDATKSAYILPDLATCPACLEETLDPKERRHGYAFTNCTHCGPRYTIIHDIPYDRPNTTMRAFPLCDACRREYEDPNDRRFHAQPVACPTCGPRLEIVNPDGERIHGQALEVAAALLREGKILALKGIGGYLLLADASKDEPVALLRRRKHREEKPFAVLFPSLEAAREFCHVGEEEARLLRSTAAPIVLLHPRSGCRISRDVSRSSPYIGVMLPYSPLHHVLTTAVGRPMVATSGNLSEEPIITDDAVALLKLGKVVDAFLRHDRPIARPCDDSVARCAGKRVTLLRRARGYAPMPVRVPLTLPDALAVGAHQKSTVAIARGRDVFVGQHIGDLDTEEARAAFRHEIDDLCRIYEFRPGIVVRDLHPDYFSTSYAEELGLPVVAVQHHHAHVAACAAENGIDEPYLGVAWDGTGYGPDGTVWGGEFFVWGGRSFDRVAHLRPFALLGGDRAIREGRRVAFALLQAIGWSRVPDVLRLSDSEAGTFRTMLDRGLNAPMTTSAGRLFDAVAALGGVALENRFEGQAAMALETAVDGTGTHGLYPTELTGNDILELDWRPMIAAVVRDVERHRSASVVSTRFHNSLAEWVVKVAGRVSMRKVVLSGGVFQNGYLAARVCERLRQQGYQPYTHQQVPPNDGGIALGQAVLAGYYQRQESLKPREQRAFAGHS